MKKLHDSGDNASLEHMPTDDTGIGGSRSSRSNNDIIGRSNVVDPRQVVLWHWVRWFGVQKRNDGISVIPYFDICPSTFLDLLKLLPAHGNQGFADRVQKCLLELVLGGLEPMRLPEVSDVALRLLHSYIRDILGQLHAHLRRSTVGKSPKSSVLVGVKQPDSSGIPSNKATRYESRTMKGVAVELLCCAAS